MQKRNVCQAAAPTLMPIRLLVVDDHALFRRGLIALLGQEPGVKVVAEAGDGTEALRHAQAQQPDVILLDNHLPGVSGVGMLPALKEVAPNTRILMLTVSEDEQDLAAALKGGAQGYVIKNIEGDALIQAITRLMHGEAVISPEMTGKLVQVFQAGRGSEAASQATSPLASLSPREGEILRHIAHGDSNKEIARSFGIAETTVKIHVQHILRKLGLNSRVQAAVFLTQHRANSM